MFTGNAAGIEVDAGDSPGAAGVFDPAGVGAVEGGSETGEDFEGTEGAVWAAATVGRGGKNLPLVAFGTDQSGGGGVGAAVGGGGAVSAADGLIDHDGCRGDAGYDQTVGGCAGYS